MLPAPRLFFYASTCVIIPTKYINACVALKAIVWYKQKLDTMPKSIQLMRSEVIILSRIAVCRIIFLRTKNITLLVFSCWATTWSHIPNQTVSSSAGFRAPLQQCQTLSSIFSSTKCCVLTLASVTLNSLRMYWGMLYSAMGSTTKYWYLADLSAGQYWWHFSCWERDHDEPQHSFHSLASFLEFLTFSIFISPYLKGCILTHILHLWFYFKSP